MRNPLPRRFGAPGLPELNASQVSTPTVTRHTSLNIYLFSKSNIGCVSAVGIGSKECASEASEPDTGATWYG